jgi:hypothetical protein
LCCVDDLIDVHATPANKTNSARAQPELDLDLL